MEEGYEGYSDSFRLSRINEGYEGCTVDGRFSLYSYPEIEIDFSEDVPNVFLYGQDLCRKVNKLPRRQAEVVRAISKTVSWFRTFSENPSVYRRLPDRGKKTSGKSCCMQPVWHSIRRVVAEE